MDIEDIIQLLMNKTGKNRNDILNLIEKKQLDAGGTISDKAAASLVSKDLGLKLSDISVPQPTKIIDLLHMAPGSSNITIVGTIKRLYAPHQFSQEDSNKIVQNLILIDSSTSIRVVMWGNVGKIVKSLNLLKGEQIRIIKGYLKNGRMGERELHLNETSSIEKIDSPDLEDIIDVWTDVLRPSSITKEHTNIREVDLQGVVVNFNNSEESERPSFLYLIDPDGENSNKLKVNFWKEKKSEIDSFEIGYHLLLEGLTIREGLQNSLEANFNRTSNLSVLGKVQLSEKQLSLENQNFQKSQNPLVEKELSSIQMGENFTLLVKVAWVGKLGSFERKDKSEGYFIRVGVFDDSGSNVIVFWDDNAKIAEKLIQYDTIRIKNAYLKENKGNLEISLSKNGKIEKILEKSVDKLPNNLPSIPIEKLTKSWKIISLWGGVVSMGNVRNFKRNDGTEGKVSSIDITDNTGDIRVVAWNDKIKLFDTLKIGQIIFINEVSMRINNYDAFEAHLNDNSTITVKQNKSEFPIWIQNLTFSNKKTFSRKTNNYERKSLGLLTEAYKEKFLNDSENGSDYSKIQNYFEFRVNVVEIFENPLFYESCPQCMKKVELLQDNTANCPNHNIVVPVPRLLLRVILDDGMNTLNTTLIGTSAERITGLSPQKLREFLNENNNDKQILKQELMDLLLGKEFIIKGRLEVRKNFSQEDEFNWDLRINYISEANALEEIKILELNQ